MIFETKTDRQQCPRCLGINTHQHGTSGGLQAYWCRDCLKPFKEGQTALKIKENGASRSANQHQKENETSHSANQYQKENETLPSVNHSKPENETLPSAYQSPTQNGKSAHANPTKKDSSSKSAKLNTKETLELIATKLGYQLKDRGNPRALVDAIVSGEVIIGKSEPLPDKYRALLKRTAKCLVDSDAHAEACEVLGFLQWLESQQLVKKVELDVKT